MDYIRRGSSVREELSFRELCDTLRSGKWTILCVTVSLAIAATLAGFIVPREYEAKTLLLPVSSVPGEDQLSPLTSLASQFGGLASIAGISLSADSKKAESVAVLQSGELTRGYIQQNNLLPILFSDEWDARQGKWKMIDPKKIPTLWKANRKFERKIRTVKTDSRTGLVTLTIEWTDPRLAAKWANGLVKMTNDYLRDQAIRESDRNIAYLTKEALETNVVEVKQAIYAVLEEQINKEMLARGTDEYAFKVIDPAVPPERPAIPRIFWILGGVFGGLLISCSFVLMRAALVSPQMGS